MQGKSWNPLGYIQLRLFGEVELCCECGDSILLPHPRTEWLLTALGLAFPSMRSREALSSMLYPRRSPNQARSNLRTLLSRLRADLTCAQIPPETVLTVNRCAIGLNPDWVRVDWVEFNEAVRSHDPAQWARALELYRGDLAHGVEAEWAVHAREHAHALLGEVLERLIQHSLDENLPELALYYLERAVHLLPSRSRWYELAIEIALCHSQPEAAWYWVRRAHNALCTGQIASTPRLQDALRHAAPLHQPPAEAQATSPFFVPRALDRFWGRTHEMDALYALLSAAFTRRDSRLINLVGVAGVGKTRLAMEVAYQFHLQTGLPTLFVPLRGIQSRQSLTEYVAHFLHTLRLPECVLCASLRETLQRYQPLLLVLDNFECAPPEGTAELVALLQSVPSLVCLTTSRRRLRVTGEVVYRVRPLPVPRQFSLDEPALNLLLDRSGIRHTTSLPESERAAAVAICQWMEGNPLGLEIVASWSTAFSLAQIAEMLRAGELLRGDNNPLHVAIRHSIEALDPAGRELLLQLSLFEGRFHLAAVRAVAPFPALHAGLRALHDASLIEEERVERIASGQTIVYYYMYDSVRSVCAEYLHPAVQTQFLERHARYYTQLVEQIDQSLYLGDAPACLHQLDLEMGNLNRALCFLWDTQQHELGLRLVLGLRHYWYLRALYHEAEEWLGRYLSVPAMTASCRARLMAWLGLMRAQLHGMEVGGALFQEALLHTLSSDDPVASREVVACYALCALYHDARDTLRLCCSVGVPVFSQSENPIELLLSQIMQAWLAADAGDHATAQSLCQQAQCAAREREFHFLECICLLTHARYCLPLDTPTEARAALLHNALRIAQTHGYLPLETLLHKTLHAVASELA